MITLQKRKQNNLKTLETQSIGFKQTSQEPFIYQKLSIKVAITSIFTALAIGSSYMLAPFINIKLIEVLIFIAGLLYGKFIGISVGVLSSLIYYGWNPYGSPSLPIYLIIVGLMTFIGLVGGIFKSTQIQGQKLKINHLNVIKFALIGFLYTFLFDISTNIIFAYVLYNGNILFSLIAGFPFMIIHLISNTILFALLVLPIYNTVVGL